MERLARISLLNDIYGALLTDKQQQLMDMFYNQDFSLGEIAELTQTSRQAVFDNLKRSEKSLENYENKLGLLRRAQNEDILLQKLKAAYEMQDWAEVKAIIDILQS